MDTTPTKTKPRKQTSLELSAPVRGALRRLKKQHGYTIRFAIERGVALLEQSLTTTQGRGL